MEDTEPSSELRPQQPSPVAADPADLAGPSSQQPWKYDIATEHASLTTTGGRIWDAARRLASYLEAMSGPLGLQRPGLRVLELGAGLGWLGMTLARNIRVDPGQGGMGEGLLEGGLQQGGPQAAASVGQQEGQGGEGGQQQPAVLRALSRPGHTRVLYAHTKHRFDTWDMRFYEELAAQGLSLAEVWETGAPSPPPSPPPLTELFPDMRVAVFQIGQQPPPS
eukprot:XP_001692644.1 predicted protein [Chlamydomonas reinhardtii]